MEIDAPDSLSVDGDDELLRQALTNLVSNAIRHAPAGGSVMLRAGRVVRQSGTESVQFSVSDTGSGIDASELPRIFDRFYRGAGGGASSTRRFGLGLAIVHEIVTRHGGSVSVESEPGRGTTCTIDLPAAGTLANNREARRQGGGA